MHVLVTCKNEDDSTKMKELEWSQHFFPLCLCERARADNSAALSPIWPNFERVRDVMNVLVTCKHEEDPI